MKNIKTAAAVLLIAAATAAFAACGPSADDELAKVNDAVVTAGDIDQYLPLYSLTSGIDLTSVTDKDALQNLRDAALKDLVDMEAIKQYMAAKNDSVIPETRDDEFKAFMDQINGDETAKTFIKDNKISEEYLAEFFDNQYYTQAFYQEMMGEVTDLEEQTRAYYDSHQQEFTMDQVKASHILTATKEEAEAILKELNDGADFAALAKEKSLDTVSAAEGGDLGYFAKGQMVAPFSEAAFATDIGKLSDIVQTDYGFHIIKVADKRTYTQTYEEAQQTIMYQILQKAYQAKLEDIKSTMKIEFSEK